MTATFQRVRCINLDAREDRWTAFQQRVSPLAACGDWLLPAPERFAAIDGKTSSPPPPEKWKATAGAYGCLRSHQRILQELLESADDAVLILEDDCCFCDGFAGRLKNFLENVPKRWHQIYLGCEHQGVAEVLCKGLIRCHGALKTHAYAVSREGASLLLPALERTLTHVDVTYAALHPDILAYAPDPDCPLCGQAAGVSDVANGARKEPEALVPAHPGGPLPIGDPPMSSRPSRYTPGLLQ